MTFLELKDPNNWDNRRKLKLFDKILNFDKVFTEN